MKLSSIKYETANYWVKQVKHGFEVYKTGITHSSRCAIIGWSGDKGLQKAIVEADKRELSDEANRVALECAMATKS